MEFHKYAIHKKITTPQQNPRCLEKIHAVMTIKDIKSVWAEQSIVGPLIDAILGAIILFNMFNLVLSEIWLSYNWVWWKVFPMMRLRMEMLLLGPCSSLEVLPGPLRPRTLLPYWQKWWFLATSNVISWIHTLLSDIQTFDAAVNVLHGHLSSHDHAFSLRRYLLLATQGLVITCLYDWLNHLFIKVAQLGSLLFRILNQIHTF